MWVLMVMSLVISHAIAPLTALLNDGRVRSKLETLAIERQIHDLETGHDRGLVWDEVEADRAMKFFRLMRHWKGKQWARKPIKWEPWQEHAILRPLFGWYIKAARDEGGIRRFRVAWIEIPRKNSKTTMAAAIALKTLIADDEDGAEVYAAATRKDQAAILLDDAKAMLRLCPPLAERTTTWKESIVCEHWSSKLTTLPFAEADGLNVHCGIVDEVHAHKDRRVWDVILGGSMARVHPLYVGITTSGRERGTPESPTIAWEQHEYARQILEGWRDGSFVDESYFAFIASAEEGDDPFDPKTWEKANPNWGVSVQKDKIESLARKSRASPAATANFMQKHLDLWVGTHSKAINIEQWKACKSTCDDLAGRDCFTAIDLGWTNDFAAVAHLFPEIESLADLHENATDDNEEETRGARTKIKNAKLVTRFYLPEGGKRDMTKEPFATWIKHGHLIVTPGNSTDIGRIFRDVLLMDKAHNLRQITIDPAGARQLGQDFMAYGEACGKGGTTTGAEFVFEFWQTPRNYNEPCKELDAMLADRRLEHDGNPIMTWMMGNMVYVSNDDGLVKPSKRKSAEKIDGAVAFLMSLGRAMFAPPPTMVGAFTLE